MTQRPPLIRISVLAVAVALIGVSLAWTYLGMRAVLDIGGACATGGPYVPARPCPEGATALLSGAIPLLLLATLVASGIAMSMRAPTLVLPMWFLLFGSLGWNFLEYAFAADPVVVGWLIPGVMFELMALPALLLWLGSSRLRAYVVDRPITSDTQWKLLHVALVVVGVWAGMLSFDAWT